MTAYNWADRHKRRQDAADAAPTQRALTPVASTPAGSYGQAALEAELEQLASTTEGGRNHQLNRAAFSLGQLVAAGHLDGQEVHDRLRATALSIGLTVSETEATLASGARAGATSPRVVQPLQHTEHVVDLSGLIAPPDELEHTQQEAGEAATPDGSDGQPRGRTSWWPRPLGERADEAAEQPAPTHLVRDDGHALLYSGKVNGLIGESESGKSWVALLAVVQAVRGGQRVWILDFEDSPASIARRLTAMGVTDDERARIDYSDPDEALGALQAQDVVEALTEGDEGQEHQGARYGVIVADGINAAMTLLGYDLNSNTDATAFFTRVLRPLARSGACVLTVDHVPKNPDQRGKGGIGAQAKRSMQDGTCLLVEVVDPFGKGQSGVLKLNVDKDRNGAVRGISGGGRYAGRAHLDSTDDSVSIRITGPDLRPADERPKWRPTGIMEKVSRLLEAASTPLSFRAIKDEINGRDATIREALSALVEDGYVQLETGPRNSVQHSLLRPYSDLEELANPSVSDRVPPCPGHGEVSVSHPIPPYGDGTQSTVAASGSVCPDQPETLDLANGQSSCNRCGDPTDDRILDETAGYCRPCGRAVHG